MLLVKANASLTTKVFGTLEITEPASISAGRSGSEFDASNYPIDQLLNTLVSEILIYLLMSTQQVS